MGSRVRERPKRLFEVFVEIGKPDGNDEAPFIIQQYPPDFDDKEAMAMIPKFAYPCKNDASKVDHFTFVLTDLDSMFRFGYCRHTTGHQTCLCIVSWLPWCEIFYKMLDLLAEITNRSESNHVTSFLQATYNHEVPMPKLPVTIVANEDMFSFTAPDPNVLPSIPSSRNLTEYYNAVDPSNMMLIFASMLHERRIYMTSKKLSRLTACIHAAEALLYPMHWQHLYIPVLPAHLIDYISAPMPYLIGVHSNLVEKLQQNRVDVGDAVIVDLDANTVTSEYDDLGDLPEDVSNYLKRSLKTDVVKNSMAKTGDAISVAFLHALVRLIGGYRDALKFRPGEPITFDPEAFVVSRSSQSTQAFLEGMLTLQIFQQFIYGRLEILNNGDGFRDIFEQQATLYADKLNSQNKYKEWLKSVKKSGKKGWNGFKVKAAPMMSTAVHSMKEQGKKAITDFKTKLSGLTDNDDKKGGNFQVSGGVVHTKPKARPATTHEATLRSTRPPRPPPPSVSSAKSDSLGRAKSSLTPDDVYDDSHLRLSYHTVDVSLMGDQDIQAAMLRSASAEMLPNHPEDESSQSSSVSSSGSMEEVDGGNIPFATLHSSDEGLNVEPARDKSPSPQLQLQQQQQEKKPVHKADKLILSRPKTVHSMQPVAPPRGRKSAKTSPGPSPQASPQVPARSPNEASLPPKPLPRQASLKRETTATIPDAPLIKFDSSESETSETFDPLASTPSPVSPSDTSFVTSPQEDNQASGDNSKDLQSLQRNTGSRVSLTRSKAFRREGPVPAVRTGVNENGSDADLTKRDSTRDLFDPLVDVGGLKVSDNSQVSTSTSAMGTHPLRADPLSSHSPRRDSSDLLMQEWSLASLAKGPSITMPVGAVRPLRFSHPNNPFLSSASQPTPAVQQSLPSSAMRAGSGHNSMYVGQGQGMYLGQQRSSVQPGTVPGQQPPRQSFPPPRAVFNPACSTRPSIPTSNFGSAYSRPMSSTAPRNPGMMNFSGPTPSSTSPFMHGGFKHVQASPAGVGGQVNVSSSSSSSGTPKQSDAFSDLLDIEFGGGSKSGSTQQQQPSPQKAAPPAGTPQPKWETFD